MNRLTAQEQLVLCLVVGLLLVGWSVKWYRAAHPDAGTKQGEGPAAVVQSAKP